MAEASDNQRMVSARVARAADKISALPDDVLLRVLSQLSSREAVHTCLLGRRWRDLWRSVPCINVSIEEFQGEDDEVVFKRFVNRLLMLRNPVALDEFRLTYSCFTGDSSNSDDANLWISHALQRNARAVKVVNRYEPLELDPAVFTSSCLKRLHIACATLDDDFFDQLQTGCPALEYLFLYDCYIRDHEIFSKTLKVLILSEQVAFNDQASISAPSLIYLSIEGDLRGGRLPILKNMASLETATVLISGEITDCDADGIRQFLGGLSHVTSLDFQYWDRKLIMEKDFRWCPTFSKLIDLTLDCSCVHEDFYGLIVFLQNSPNLKKLTLELDQSDKSTIAGELEDRSFTCEQLEIVEIICSETSEMLPRLTMEKNFLWCPTFSNLINLTLDTWCVHADFYALIVFLQNSPSLKKLTLKLDKGSVSVITGELENRSFTCEQLEIVEIICAETSELLPRVTQFFCASGIRPDQMRISHRS